MAGPNKIQFVRRADIDIVRWNNCIDESQNGLIYAYSFYLDAMAENWDGLVMGDYDAVMPLPWKKKYGIYYLTQPFLVAQLGLFGKKIDPQLLEDFLLAIPRKFKYWDFYLNHGNVHHVDSFKIYLRANFVLDLNKPYPELLSGYRENIRRNMKKAEQLGCRAVTDFDVEKVITLAANQMQGQAKNASENIDRFRKLYKYLLAEGKARTYGIESGKQELLASCVFFFSHDRAYYILVGNHPDGKTIGASHALIDAFIKDHSRKQLLLDFEGSDIRNLAFFYSSFGAVEEKYASIRLNRLPFFLKWLKK